MQSVAFGSDFDGAISGLPTGLEDCSRLPRLTERLLARGYSPEDVQAILGGSFLRVLGAVRPRLEGGV